MWTELIDFSRILLLFRMLNEAGKEKYSKEMCLKFMLAGLIAVTGGGKCTEVKGSFCVCKIYN